EPPSAASKTEPPSAAPKTEPPKAPAPASPMLVSPPRASGAATSTPSTPPRASVPVSSSPSTPPIPKPPPSSQPRTEFQRLLDEVETGFDAILEPEKPTTIAPPADDPAGPPTTESEFDESQAKQLFFELVVANARPIRDFMIEVRLGEPHAAWVDFCGPAVKAILGSAEGMGYADLAVKLRGFIAVLDTLKADPSRVIRGEARERVIDTYGELIVFLPEAFGVEAEANAREAVIVRSILSRVPGLYKVGLDRVYATGLVSLGLFYVSRPEDIAALSGLDLDLAERIAGRFRDYRKMVTELSPARGRSEERSRLRDASEAMLRASEAYDAARPATVEKRTLRRTRLDAMAEVALWLARLGEVDRLASISTMPFAARARDVLTFLSDVDKRAEAVHRAT
ncbi:MAG TPA: hypothetical protein VL400_26310, partial [Polyangiaceae bacterium]|nr:hypothetical protein [Polyangiaceae bacterium]